MRTRWRHGLQLRGSGASEPGNASSNKEQQQGCFSAVDNVSRQQKICIYTNKIVPGMVPHMEMLTHENYPCAVINVHLQRWMRGKLLLILNTFKEVLALLEAARWMAVSDKK